MSTVPPSLLSPRATRAAVRPPVAASARVSTPAWPVHDAVTTLRGITLESGERLEQISVHYRLEGTLNAARDNVVLVVHALTGTTRASEWWKGVIGEGAAIDPTKHAILCPNLLGGCDGTTGPSNHDPDALPPFSTRDQAAVLAQLLDALDIDTPLLICGGSLGGMVTLEFAASFPDRVRGAVALAAPAAQTAQGLAWNAIMRRALALGGAHEGLALARMVGMLSYRTPEGLERRFGRTKGDAGGFRVNEWLDIHGEKLVARFDATSYGALIDAMDTHDIGRGRGGISAALAPVRDRLTGVGIPGDLLYPAESVREWTNAANAAYADLPSIHGHDAFLLETERVARILASAVAAAEARPVRRQRPAVALANATAHANATATPARNAVITPRKTLRIALAGCGHVGGALLDLLREREGSDVDVQVQRVLVRDPARERPALRAAVESHLTSATACITDPDALLGDDVDLLVEVIGGTTTAAGLVETALRRGIRVVTANKALLGERGAELVALAAAHQTRLDFEGAVCGAIPIVRCVRNGAAGVGITKVSGILNGTSNFVLEQITAGASFADAVATAQRLGYAEADPTRDLSGQDAEDKLRILAWLAFGVEPASLFVYRRGLDAEVARWATSVARDGDQVKLLASCTLIDGQLVARIEPTRVAGDDAWAQVKGPFNRIVIESASAGSIVFQGPGAGGLATAGAVLSDVLAR
ncbi:MAG: homoserine dehydrogenase [Gemmatimonadaceae bacterium]|nr:homoserine dehydrogenase [Gemmatimonadaceae bacterium]